MSKQYQLEHNAQVAVVRWWKLAHSGLGVPDVLLAVPNGGHRHMSVAKAMRAEGQRPGVPDLFLPVPVFEYGSGYSGLWIEMKQADLKPKRNGKGGVSDVQRWWLDELAELGYRTEVCYGAEDAIETITKYLKG